jgi:hypothetical protein
MKSRRFRNSLRTLTVMICISLVVPLVSAAVAAACEGGGGSECRAAPTVTTTGQSGVEPHSAYLNGTVNPQGCTTEYWAEYRPVGGTFFNIGGGSLGSSITPEAVSVHWSGFAAHTTYEFRIGAMNMASGSPVYGSIKSFTTPYEPPLATTGEATEKTTTTAKLNGVVNAHGSATTYFFEYGLVPKSPEHNSEGGSLGAGTENVNINKVIKELKTKTTYYYRLTATNGGGTTIGTEKSFTTP